VLGAGGICGGLMGVWLLPRVNEQLLRIGVIAIGIVLTIGLFMRAR